MSVGILWKSHDEMMKVKANYKNTDNDTECSKKKETQEHIFRQCPEKSPMTNNDKPTQPSKKEAKLVENIITEEET